MLLVVFCNLFYILYIPRKKKIHEFVTVIMTLRNLLIVGSRGHEMRLLHLKMSPSSKMAIPDPTKMDLG